LAWIEQSAIILIAFSNDVLRFNNLDMVWGIEICLGVMIRFNSVQAELINRTVQSYGIFGINISCYKTITAKNEDLLIISLNAAIKNRSSKMITN
jgi:hypothetical protein